MEGIEDGMFNASNPEHIKVLSEYLVGKNLNPSVVDEFCQKVYSEGKKGKYPERQAYNKDGVLVTFPTPEYKKNAIDRGTHYQDDPTKSAPNLFNQTAPATTAAPTAAPTNPSPTPTPEPKPEPVADPASNIKPDPAAAVVPSPAAPEEKKPEPEKTPQEKEAEKLVALQLLSPNDNSVSIQMREIISYAEGKGYSKIVEKLRSIL